MGAVVVMGMVTVAIFDAHQSGTRTRWEGKTDSFDANPESCTGVSDWDTVTA